MRFIFRFLFAVFGGSKRKRRRRPAPQRRGTFNAKTAKSIATGSTIRGRAYIVDGDTVVIQNIQVRLFGIDAPELDHPYGQKAKWALHHMCKGQMIVAELLENDIHGRVVAKCYLPDGRDISAEMVKLGMAIDWPKFSGGAYLDLELPNVRKKLWLADARQKGRMHVWENFEARRKITPSDTRL